MHGRIRIYDGVGGLNMNRHSQVQKAFNHSPLACDLILSAPQVPIHVLTTDIIINSLNTYHLKHMFKI